MSTESKRKSKVKISRQDKIFQTVIYLLSALMLIIVIYPLYFVVIASFPIRLQLREDRYGCFPKD